MFEVEDNIMSLSKEQKERYFRTTFLKEIGEEGQLKLLNSKVIVIGCGGLASSSLIYLTSIGVGNITIVDDDVVKLDNLPRQILYEYKNVGKSKVKVTKKKLKRINPDVNVVAKQIRLTKHNASRILKGHDIVLDCTDNFDTKFLINDTCLKLNIPFVIAGVSDFQGQICTCIPHKTKDFRSLFPIRSLDLNEEYLKIEKGVFPLSVGVVSNVASMEVIKCLLGIGELLTNKLAVINLLHNQYQIIEFPE